MEGVRLRELLILCTACLCCEVPRQTLGGVSHSSCGSQFLVKNLLGVCTKSILYIRIQVPPQNTWVEEVEKKKTTQDLS